MSVLLVAFFAMLYVGCGNDNNNNNTVATSVTGFNGAGGGGPGTACRNGAPDGICEPTESCDCPECEFAASCTGQCSDDGVCQCDTSNEGCGRGNANPEDCSCSDCFQKVNGCLGGDRGCNTEAQNNGDPAQCDSDENCTCADCRGVPECENNCTDDGICVPYYEGCTCADCAGTTFCGGSGPASSSAAMSSSAVTTGVGGAGGSGSAAGGAGGAGGN